MNWLEAIFHYAPDHGNGSAEALLIVLAAIIIAATPRNRRRGTVDALRGRSRPPAR